MNFTRFYTPATFRRITYSTEREDGVDRIKVPMILIICTNINTFLLCQQYHHGEI